MEVDGRFRNTKKLGTTWTFLKLLMMVKETSRIDPWRSHDQDGWIRSSSEASGGRRRFVRHRRICCLPFGRSEVWEFRLFFLLLGSQHALAWAVQSPSRLSEAEKKNIKTKLGKWHLGDWQMMRTNVELMTFHLYIRRMYTLMIVFSKFNVNSFRWQSISFGTFLLEGAQPLVDQLAGYSLKGTANGCKNWAFSYGLPKPKYQAPSFVVNFGPAAVNRSTLGLTWTIRSAFFKAPLSRFFFPVFRSKLRCF